MFADERTWYEYDCGVLLRVDPDAGTVTTELEYHSPACTNVDDNPQVLFKSATVVGDTLYATTQTEVILFHVPSLEQIGHISLPCFNDVHHVRPMADGSLRNPSTNSPHKKKTTATMTIVHHVGRESLTWAARL